MNEPRWFKDLIWSDPRKIEDLRNERTLIPKKSGVYVFTNYSWALEKNTGVLYVGKAKSLHSRVQSYLADPGKILVLSSRSGERRISTSLRHPGKVQLLMEVQQRMRVRIPVMPITRSGRRRSLVPAQGDHQSERSDAGFLLAYLSVFQSQYSFSVPGGASQS